MGMSAAHCQGNIREFQSVWRVVTLYTVQYTQCAYVWDLSFTGVSGPWGHTEQYRDVSVQTG